ncbi:VCBS repeat-containing protein [Streptomyces sp. A0642]|uniref:FG-GAP repeat domain-containing protein n=1 Tax=Streptomyces sp. A0642 TaxID=2563100 RepID=UPI0019D0DF00|nr:VCBS repeat-containing protein [Streptomyces sp. A0642]
MPRHKHIGRVAAVGGSLSALVAAATGITPAPAVAQDLPIVHVNNVVLRPDSTWGAGAAAPGPVLDGTMVYAYATKPLTGTPGDGAGLPAGLTFGAQKVCTPAPQAIAVYLCRVSGDRDHFAPVVTIPADTPHDTMGYYGAVYAPTGADLTAAVQAAQTAGATPADGTHGAGTFTVKRPEHVAQNSLAFNAPDIEAGKSSPQTLRVHAVDGGHLDLWFGPAPEQYGWSSHGVDIRVTSVTAGESASCTHRNDSLTLGIVLLTCDLTPGDTEITYTLTSAPGTESWHIQAHASYRVYSWGRDDLTADAVFAVNGLPVRERHSLLARDTAGKLWLYQGTGNGAAPFRTRSLVSSGWQTYNVLTKLAPWSSDKVAGGLVGRDASGTLWYHQAKSAGPFAAKVRVGGGWNTYNQLNGAGDLTADGKPDLIARDTAGTLWLYRGTGNSTTPFATRAMIGKGWNSYSRLAGTADLTADGNPDLIARDNAGTLWLYRGTGKASAPFATRSKVGAGWNTYNQLTATGDLTADGKPDAVARDTAGTLWLYRGTGKASAPFAARTRIGSGWNTYNSLN